MKTRIPCQIQHMRQWRRKQNTQPRMLFIACWKTSRRAWHGSIDSGKLEECCIGWCSETCRIELTCGCGTTCPRNRAKLLSFLSLRLAFPICAPGVFHALERIAWILKESAKFDMAQQGKMSEKKMSATAKPEQRPEGPGTP